MIQGLARPFDNTHSPVGVWNFYQNLNDSSGAGRNLTLQAGTIRYASLYPGLGGVLLDGSTCLYHNVASTPLAITGDMTIEVMMQLDPVTPVDAFIVGYSTALGGTSATNWLYSLGTGSSSQWQPRWLQYSGANVSATRTLSGRSVHSDEPILFTGTRSGGVVQWYVNGQVFGGPSGVLATPTDGVNSRFRVGASTDAGGRITGIVGGVKLIASALTAAQVKDEYNRTLGFSMGLAP